MKIALAQLAASTDAKENLQKGLAFVDDAAKAGAKAVCFAELGLTRFYPQKPAGADFRDLAEPIPGPTTEAFQKKAKEHGIVVILNLFERDGDKCYDTSPVIDAGGALLGRTRMVHIAEMPCFHEQGFYTPGDTGAPVYVTKAGRIGVAICYDRHYPEYMRALALQKADIVFVPQAGAVGEWPDGLFEAEMRTAAFQNGYWLALTNRVGQEDCVAFAGESFVVNPEGQVTARAGKGDELLVVDVDPATAQDSHARRLFFRDRRPELYPKFVSP